MTDEAAEYATACARASVSRWRNVTREDREDAVQSALLAVVRSWARYDASRGSWRTYVDRVVRRALSAWLRQTRRRALAEVAAPLPPAPPRRTLGDLIGRVKDPMQKRLVLARISGVSHGECIRILGISRRAYGALLHALHDALAEGFDP